MKKFYITTPIYYVNDKPHVGHAYTTIAADVLARWKRMKGEEVFFLTGADEHGSKIAQAAQQLGCSPQEYADRLTSEFKSLWKALNISNDDFIRTTEKRHVALVQKVFKKLYDSGEIVKGFYEDWYCVSCESFWLENELAERKCPDCGRAVEKLKEESYFFKLSNYTDKLLAHYKQNPKFLSPSNRAQEIINFVKEGLKDLSVSRLKEKWGIAVPFDSGHTVYVWFDALLNYLTAAGYLAETRREEAEEKGSLTSSAGSSFEEVWPCDIHFVGKEIFRFHAAIWPAMLAALKLPMPQMVFAHGWWTVEGEKMSKSRGNVVDPLELARKFGVDAVRYFLLREISFGADGDFSKKALMNRYNSELANDLGNLFSRTLTLIEKNFNGTLKTAPEGVFADRLKKASEDIVQSYEKAAFQEVLERLMAVVAEVNRYLDQKAPWNLAKTDLDKTEKALTECLVVLRWLAQGFYPFMPDSAMEMSRQLGEEALLGEGDGKGLKEGWRIFKSPVESFSPGRKVHRAGSIFPRKENE